MDQHLTVLDVLRLARGAVIAEWLYRRAQWHLYRLGRNHAQAARHRSAAERIQNQALSL